MLSEYLHLIIIELTFPQQAGPDWIPEKLNK